MESKRYWDARHRMLDVRERERQLVPVAEIEPRLLAIAATFAKWAESMGRKKSVSGREVQRRVNELLVEALERYATELKQDDHTDD